MSDQPRLLRCRSCHASLDEVVLDLGERPDADDFRPADQAGTPWPRARLDLRRCRSCSLVQLGEPGVPPRGPHGHGALYSTSTSSHLVAWSLGLLGAGVVRPGERALDIGAGAGQLLRPLREAGVEVAGLEHDPAMVALARADGLDVRRGTFDGPTAQALAASGPSFDLVLLNHTLAHASDLAALVASVVAVLAPGGTVAVEMHHLLELVRLGQFDLVTPAHGSYLSLIALEPLLAAHDLAAMAAETSPNYGGTLRLLVRRRSVGRPDPAVAAVLGEERRAALDRPAGFTGLAQLMARTVRQVREHLDQAAASGSPLVGYGAPARGAMLLDMVGATVATLPYTVDRSPEKQGHLLAGTDIPILAPAVLEERRPEGILILPWPLRDEVAGQLAGLHDAGTRFSVALPSWSTW
ncbi:MAG TPA: methyltransferase domain-containing protein [Candidatus Limnocylindrales bacterium]